MWIFCNDAFVSIVEDDNNSNYLKVRARAEGDIEKFFGDELVSEYKIKPIETYHTDYRFRVMAPKSLVAIAMVDKVMGIDYTNFKDSVTEKDRGNTYLDVWSDMYEFQEKRHGYGIYSGRWYETYREEGIKK